ncbi:MAG TPA: endonuclease/exonuclease/phosphatase family protein, partial [Actinomycetota bacterium]|nr:endonuclease/exonuclease/phosphatase family protein [Actinomycetota bacterium]
MRVMVWNVHGFRAGVRAVAAVVQEAQPDVLLLNEARFRWRLRRLARRLGMRAHHGMHGRRRVPNAILVRPPWRIVEGWSAPLSPTRRMKRRGLVAANVRHGGERLTVACVHLGVSDPERVRHAREVTDMLAGAPPPLVLGGDLNEGPDRPAARWIAERYFDTFAGNGGDTFPATEPRARIDYVFVTEDLEVTA